MCWCKCLPALLHFFSKPRFEVGLLSAPSYKEGVGGTDRPGALLKVTWGVGGGGWLRPSKLVSKASPHTASPHAHHGTHLIHFNSQVSGSFLSVKNQRVNDFFNHPCVLRSVSHFLKVQNLLAANQLLKKKRVLKGANKHYEAIWWYEGMLLFLRSVNSIVLILKRESWLFKFILNCMMPEIPFTILQWGLEGREWAGI